MGLLKKKGEIPEINFNIVVLIIGIIIIAVGVKLLFGTFGGVIPVFEKIGTIIRCQQSWSDCLKLIW